MSISLKMSIVGPGDLPLAARSLGAPVRASFAEIYDSCAKFVWRVLLRLGVPDASVEDVVQEVFLVIHRRLPEFRAHSTTRTWVYGIAVRVARNHRRTQTRRRLGTLAIDGSVELTRLPEHPDRAPDALLAKAEAAQLLNHVLGELDDELREVFVLAELEEMTAQEIALTLDVNSNTISSRLRTARRAFDHALGRARARDEWRVR